jgi:hypothetical protein
MFSESKSFYYREQVVIQGSDDFQKARVSKVQLVFRVLTIFRKQEFLGCR